MASNKLKIFILLIIPPILWAGNLVVGSRAAQYIGPFSLGFYRWSIAGIIILAITHRSLWRHRQLIAAQWQHLVVLGALSVALFPSFLYLGLNFTSSNNAGIIQASMPLSIILLSFLLGQGKPKALQMVGLLISITGVLWVVTRGNISSLLTFAYNPGDVFVLLAVFCWAFYSVLLTRWRNDALPGAAFLACQIIAGWFICLPLFLFEQASHAPTIWTTETYLIIAYVSLFPSLISLYFWQQGVALGGANIASLFVPLISVFAVLFSYLFLGEHLKLFQLVGMALVLVGLALAFHGSFKRPPN